MGISLCKMGLLKITIDKLNPYTFVRYDFVMRRLLILSILIFTSETIYAQYAQRIRVIEHYSLTYAMGKKVSAPSFMYSQKLAMGKNNSFALGTGIRMTYFTGKNQSYSGTETNNLKVTFIPVPRASMTAINIPFIAEYNGKKLIAGVNIDLIGFAFGKRRDSLTVSNFSGRRLDSLSASPTRFNLPFGSRGTTNNEIYIGFKPQEELTIRAGVSFLFTQYNSRYRRNNKDVDFGRFGRDIPVMPFISLVFNFER